MSSATATVEVLTAEVQVLMVGSRQVTLSVYRQLDRVLPREIEPFGRVNDSKDPPMLAVVGKGSNGELTRALLEYDEGEPYKPGSVHDNRLYERKPPFDASGWVYWSFAKERYEFEDHLRHDARLEYVDLWKDLPLIVLAGLR